jgi:hypothetical protein
MAAAGAISHNPRLGNDVVADWVKLGENVGSGASPDVIQQAFVTSTHHYVNLVDATFTKVGIGVVEAGNTIYVTVDFMRLAAVAAIVPAVAAAAPATRPSLVRPAATPTPIATTQPASVPAVVTPATLVVPAATTIPTRVPVQFTHRLRLPSTIRSPRSVWIVEGAALAMMMVAVIAGLAKGRRELSVVVSPRSAEVAP